MKTDLYTITNYQAFRFAKARTYWSGICQNKSSHHAYVRLYANFFNNFNCIDCNIIAFEVKEEVFLHLFKLCQQT